MLRHLIKGSYRVVISQHTSERAKQRRIDDELIENCVKSGKIIRFGKNRVKFEKRFVLFTLVCVDEIVGNTIKIATIEKR